MLQVLSFSGFCVVFESRKQMHPVGLEPTTFGSEDRRSIQLSYGCVFRTVEVARRTARRSGQVLSWEEFIEIAGSGNRHILSSFLPVE